MATTIDLQTLFTSPCLRGSVGDAGDATEGARAALVAVAGKIARTRRPGARSDIPAGAVHLAQFVVLDLDQPVRGADGESGSDGRLALRLVYGGGPRADAACYQVPAAPGAARHLLRLGRTRPRGKAAAWGSLRDLPRVACPHLDAHGDDGRTEVLVPDARSDSNLLLAQIHVLWSLLHNAVAGRLAERMAPEAAFAAAQRIVHGIYRDVVRHDLLGTWLMPRLRERYAAETPHRLEGGAFRAREAFLAGVARLGHGMVREIYALNDTIEVAGLRTILRHTGSGRPHEMPLADTWLVDFSRFFSIGSGEPQRARAIGPHVARPFAHGGQGDGGSSDGLVLRDLIACSRGGLPSVRSLIGRVTRAEPRLFEGCFAQDEAEWRRAVAAWLADTGLGAGEIEGLAGDPPLTLFLMLEAEADSGGQTLGALGSVLAGEALAAALPPFDRDAALDAGRRAVFGTAVPATMAELVRFLQRHYRFPAGARLHPADAADAHPRRAEAAAEPDETVAVVRAAEARSHPGETTMFDIQNVHRQPVARIEIADYIEYGRLAALWATDPASRPGTMAELRLQLDGIAVIPERFKSFDFGQSTPEHLVLALPAQGDVEESLDRVTDPMGEATYPLPQFYADHFRPGYGPVMTPLDTLLARIADYTIAQCR